MLRYLKGTEDVGLKYLTREETEKKTKEFSEDWPKEAFDEKSIGLDRQFLRYARRPKESGCIGVNPMFGTYLLEVC